MYTCGPTVYDFAHIGHARTYTFSDILKRTLEFNGYKVNHVMNITDVGHLTSDADTGDDKIEKTAEREHKSALEIARFYTDDFFSMLEALNIKTPQIVCKATDNIPEMIDLIKTLERKGFTYETQDGVYFDTSKFEEYGILMGKMFESLQKTLRAGARVEMVPGKRNPTDFALWKFSPKDSKRQMEWDSPWPAPGRGKVQGFPGWHIECSAMSMKFLGETFDIHTGGIDHVPVHHTNEIAQSEAATGKKFVKYWVEGNHLLVEGEKMSKSLGNFFRVADIIEKGFDPIALRYLYLTAHYRSELNFTWESLEGAQNALNNLREEISYWDEAKVGCAEFEKNFKDAISDDLNTPKAIAVMFAMVKSDYPGSAKRKSAEYMDQVLGLKLSEVKKLELTTEARELIDKRESFRLKGEFAQADKVRDELLKMGIEVEDTSEGSRWRLKNGS